MASELGRSSFFITRQMDHQFRGQVTDFGLLAPILQLLVRTGHTVLKVSVMCGWMMFTGSR